MAVSGPQRYCPSCGLETEAQFCAEDGVATVERRRLDVDVTAIHAGDVIEGRYRVTGVLGRGGFGAVYSAVHTGTQQPVALKMLLADPATTDDDEIRRFYREARITANLSHTNTVRVFDVGQTAAGALFIAMELLHGPTLEQHLRGRQKRGEVLTEREAIEIAIPMLRSLYEAHRKGLVHRDLKPANIMLSHVDMGDDEDDDDDDDVLVKVLDFGIARPQESSLTGAGTSLGTPAYMSPEQCRSADIDPRSDLYSLGIILFRCVTGAVPFRHPNPLSVMFKHASEPPPDLHTMAKTPLSDGFVDLVMRALAKQPEDRFASAREMRKALEAARDGVPFVPKTARYQRGKGDLDAPGPDSEQTGSVSLEPTPTPSSQRRGAQLSQRVSVDDVDEHAMTGALPAATVPAADGGLLSEETLAATVLGDMRLAGGPLDLRPDDARLDNARLEDGGDVTRSAGDSATIIESGDGETHLIEQGIAVMAPGSEAISRPKTATTAAATAAATLAAASAAAIPAAEPSAAPPAAATGWSRWRPVAAVALLTLGGAGVYAATRGPSHVATPVAALAAAPAAVAPARPALGVAAAATVPPVAVAADAVSRAPSADAGSTSDTATIAPNAKKTTTDADTLSAAATAAATAADATSTSGSQPSKKPTSAVVHRVARKPAAKPSAKVRATAKRSKHKKKTMKKKEKKRHDAKAEYYLD